MSLYFVSEIGVVGNHQRNLGIQFTRLPTPEQINQTMPVL